MTERQLKFCKCYLASQDKKEAAMAAGYTQKNAAAAGGRLLRNPQVQNYLSKLKPNHSEPVAGNEEILEYLTRVLRSDDELISIRDKMRAAELFGKNLSLFSDNNHDSKPCVVFCGENDIQD